MEKTDYIGLINIKSLRDYILDKKLTEQDAILLNTLNFDNIVLEHRETYREAIKIPFFFLGVLIDEDTNHKVPEGRVSVIKDDSRSTRKLMQEKEILFQDPKYYGTVVYRCGWCGNIVDYDGTCLDTQTRNHKIMLLKNHSDYVKTKAVSGYCCPNGNK